MRSPRYFFMGPRLFLLSPANCSGPKAQQLMSPRSAGDLAARLRAEGAPIGDVFSFVSSLYFRGKLAYARTFARPPLSSWPGDTPLAAGGTLIITSSAGLRAPETPVTLEALRRFADENVDASNAAYRRPLVSSAEALAREIGPDCDVILLGSIASAKYVDVLLDVFGSRLLFPRDFVGRGDMSRGGLMLRAAAAGVELEYQPVAGAMRRGPRPPKLAPLRAPTRRT
jgi:hypothetical protein